MNTDAPVKPYRVKYHYAKLPYELIELYHLGSRVQISARPRSYEGNGPLNPRRAMRFDYIRFEAGWSPLLSIRLDHWVRIHHQGETAKFRAVVDDSPQALAPIRIDVIAPETWAIGFRGHRSPIVGAMISDGLI